MEPTIVMSQVVRLATLELEVTHALNVWWVAQFVTLPMWLPVSVAPQDHT